MTLPFEFVVDGPPVSQQARRRERVNEWEREVRRAAESYWPIDAVPVTHPVRLEITHFYEDVELDVDNVAKPIIDALKGLIFLDDRQVTDLLCRKRDLGRSLRVTNPSSVLAEGLSRDNDFLLVTVMEAPDQEAFI